jgi:hypothetical protein
LLWSDAKLGAVVVGIWADVAGALTVAGVDIVLSAPAAVGINAASDDALTVLVWRGCKVGKTWLEVLTAALAVLAAKSATRMVLSCISKV